MAQHLLIQVEHHYLKATYISHNLQHYRLTQPKHRQAKPTQTAWRVTFAARHQATPRPTVSRTSPGGAHFAARCHKLQCTSLIVYRLMHIPVPPYAIPVAKILLFFAPKLVCSTIQIARDYCCALAYHNPSLIILSQLVQLLTAHIPNSHIRDE